MLQCVTHMTEKEMKLVGSDLWELDLLIVRLVAQSPRFVCTRLTAQSVALLIHLNDKEYH